MITKDRKSMDMCKISHLSSIQKYAIYHNHNNNNNHNNHHNSNQKHESNYQDHNSNYEYGAKRNSNNNNFNNFNNFNDSSNFIQNDLKGVQDYEQNRNKSYSKNRSTTNQKKYNYDVQRVQPRQARQRVASSYIKRQKQQLFESCKQQKSFGNFFKNTNQKQHHSNIKNKQTKNNQNHNSYALQSNKRNYDEFLKTALPIKKVYIGQSDQYQKSIIKHNGNEMPISKDKQNSDTYKQNSDTYNNNIAPNRDNFFYQTGALKRYSQQMKSQSQNKVSSSALNKKINKLRQNNIKTSERVINRTSTEQKTDVTYKYTEQKNKRQMKTANQNNLRYQVQKNRKQECVKNNQRCQVQVINTVFNQSITPEYINKKIQNINSLNRQINERLQKMLFLFCT